ncbi:MAG: leucine-rich repeat domain-containing protein [Thermoguttaceae bacterium]
MNDTRKPRLRWYQFTLRSLFIVMFLACIGMSWVSVKMRQARKQKELVEEIKKLGGVAGHDDAVGNWILGVSPKWLRNLLGDDFFTTVDNVAYFTKVGDAGLKPLTGLTELRFLFLQNTKVTDAGLEHLKGLTRLVTLYVGETKVTDAGLEHLKGLTRLVTLYVGETTVTDAGLEYLKGLTRLRGLSLESTKVTDEGVRKLKRVLPHCEIVY